MYEERYKKGDIPLCVSQFVLLVIPGMTYVDAEEKEFCVYVLLLGEWLFIAISEDSKKTLCMSSRHTNDEFSKV